MTESFKDVKLEASKLLIKVLLICCIVLYCVTAYQAYHIRIFKSSCMSWDNIEFSWDIDRPTAPPFTKQDGV